MALKLNNENFEEVMGKGMPVVIDFWATWCGPCRMVSPIIDELAEEYDGKVIICKCDVGEDGDEIAAQYRVRNVPTILFFKDGNQVDKHVGTADKEQLKAKVEALLTEKGYSFLGNKNGNRRKHY